MSSTETKTRKAVEDAVREIIAAEHHGRASFVRTPVLYPSGGTVVVRVDDGPESFVVSDMGLGYQEAEMMGAGAIYSRQGRVIAESAGVGFDSQSFFVLKVERDRLAGAIVSVANCSQQAVAAAAYRVAERKTVEAGEILYERLVRVFSKPKVTKDEDFIGASNTKWHVAAVVRTAKEPTIFEPVIKHHASIATAAMKFHDIALLPQPPTRIAVVRNKKEFDTYLSVLSQAAHVIEEKVSDSQLEKLAA
jgi:hypothetical protein